MAAEDADHGRPRAAAAGGAQSSASVAGAAAVAPLTGSLAQPDCWGALRTHTPARLALGRAGAALPTTEVLRFGWDHAQARDAVHTPLDADALQRDIEALGLRTLRVASRAPDRLTYLMRPDLGRRLQPEDARALELQSSSQLPSPSTPLSRTAGEGQGVRAPGAGYELALVAADGLSATAVQQHAAKVLQRLLRLLPGDWRLAPVVIATQARVALGDEIGERLRADLVAVLIGERPGLSSPDSLGIYLTWAPRVGRTDAERNCISNVRPAGLTYEQAGERLAWLCGEAWRIERTGVELKDRHKADALR